VDKASPAFKKGMYFIGAKHPEFGEFVFPEISVVVNPWRYIPDGEYKQVIRIEE
jgi:hypothetical protein